jgi:peptidoglycan-N-acetylglucosamine deacetylase
MRFFRPLWFSRLLYPDALFRVKTKGKVLCLTFDDGPVAETTFPLLRILSDNMVKAVFFCTGEAALANSQIISAIKESGHIIGNHGFFHQDGFLKSSDEYLENVRKASEITSKNIFRPPFGRMKRSQYLMLKKDYKIFMWDIMPYDFDPEFGAARSLAVLKKLMRPGSIIVLHDNSKSNMLEFIEEFIVYAKREGYRFVILPEILPQNSTYPTQ